MILTKAAGQPGERIDDEVRFDLGLADKLLAVFAGPREDALESGLPRSASFSAIAAELRVVVAKRQSFPVSRSHCRLSRAPSIGAPLT